MSIGLRRMDDCKGDRSSSDGGEGEEARRGGQPRFDDSVDDDCECS